MGSSWKNKKLWKTVKEAIEYLEDEAENKGTNHIFSKHSEDIKQKINNVKIGESLYKSYGDSFHKCDPDKPSRTVKENHGGVNLHPKKARALTPREMARIQTFPDDFIFEGSKSKQLVQIGNAVPVKLAYEIGRHFKKVLGY